MSNDPNAHLPSHSPENKPNCYEHFGQCEYVEGDCDTCFWGYSCLNLTYPGYKGTFLECANDGQ